MALGGLVAVENAYFHYTYGIYYRSLLLCLLLVVLCQVVSVFVSFPQLTTQVKRFPSAQF